MRQIPIEEQFNGARLRIEQLESENAELKETINAIISLYNLRLKAEQLIRKMRSAE